MSLFFVDMSTQREVNRTDLFTRKEAAIGGGEEKREEGELAIGVGLECVL